MRNLFLLRHAKSSWKDTSLDDFDRPLNKRGKSDTPLMAEKFHQKKIEIDQIISSPSKRTTETAKIFAAILNYEQDIICEQNLYLASDNKIVNTITLIDERIKSVLLVAHNPGITNLVNKLSDLNLDNIPTSGIVGFSFEGSWKDFNVNECKFLFYEYPKKLK